MPYTGTESSWKDSHVIVETLAFDGVTTLTASTYTATKENDAWRPIVLDRAAGIAVTLPAATGSGATYRFFVKTTASGGNYVVKVANATDVMDNSLSIVQDSGTGAGAAKVYAAAAGDDTVTLNGTTTGGYAGAQVWATDYAAGFWIVKVLTKASGTAATPFSATVS